MWVVFLEIGVAFSLLVLIVWWTWPKKDEAAKKREDHRDQ
jgi:hypothetical protein